MEYNIREHLKNFEPHSYSKTPEAVLAIPSVELLDCSYGINPFGYSRRTLGRGTGCPALEGDGGLSNYPDPFYTQLRRRIAQSLAPNGSVAAGQVRVGTGSMGVLEKLCKLFIDVGSSALGFCPQFSDFREQVLVSGGRYDGVPLTGYNNYRFDAAALLQRLDAGYKLVYIDNPSNPTGQIIPLGEVEKVVRAARRQDVVVIVDEAYGGFMERANSAVNLVGGYPNLAVVRSVSKASGLAGLRLGYIVAQGALLKEYDKVDLPFAVAAPAILYSDCGAEDEDFLAQSRERVAAVKTHFLSSLTRLRVWATSPSVPIMVLEHPDEGVNLFDEFVRRKVFVEPHSGFQNMRPSCVRLRIPPDLSRLAEIATDIEKQT